MYCWSSGRKADELEWLFPQLESQVEKSLKKMKINNYIKNDYYKQLHQQHYLSIASLLTA